MHDRVEYAALVKKQQQERTNGMLPGLHLHAQAALKAEHLTGDETWDWFRTFILGTIEQTQQNIVAARHDLDSPQTVNGDDIQRIRIAIFQAEAFIAALNWVLELPKDLKGKGEEAKKLLERLPSDYLPQ